jgi:hypothetical protein
MSELLGKNFGRVEPSCCSRKQRLSADKALPVFRKLFNVLHQGRSFGL